MKNSDIIDILLEDYSSFKNSKISGRYITYKHLEPHLKKLGESLTIEEIGRSVLNVPIHAVTLGKGPIRILGWSQMHGNESTTTKAVFDLFHLFSSKNLPPVLNQVLECCTIKIIPMLNPDGAARYTRVNVNEVDLNRDANALQEEESRVLRNYYEIFAPDYCLNLHDQRTIFAAGDSKNPATLSFLAPAMDEARNIPSNRERAMQLIAAMNSRIQNLIPGQVGRYDDAFNINCTGDTFQSLETPTILFEAGHYQNDYEREKTRQFVAMAILCAVLNICDGEYEKFTVEDYLEIPENKKTFFDVILRNAQIEGGVKDVAIQFEEKVKAGKIYFEPVVQKIAADLAFYGHQEIDCKGGIVKNASKEEINENAIVDQILLNNDKLSIKTSFFVH